VRATISLARYRIGPIKRSFLTIFINGKRVAGENSSLESFRNAPETYEITSWEVDESNIVDALRG
jgi:hypothetical protein